MARNDKGVMTTRLIPALPAEDYVDHPEELDRFFVRVLPDGTITFRGSKERIAEFLERCAAAGIPITVAHINQCG
ncbi:MAG TPA: hypothetical protein VGF38_08180 [Ktedonobacterales bacterium]|jgi:hypothetical protein